MAECDGKTVAVLNSPSPPAICASPSSSFAAAASAELPSQPTFTAKRLESSTLKSRTLYRGDKIAACRAQPLATLSSWFIVVERSFPPKASEQTRLTQGTRDAPPTTSTESISSTGTFDSAITAARSALALAIAGSHIFSKSARVMVLEKSSSSIKHSTAQPASLFAERIFFVLVTASSSLNAAFLLVRGSHPVFFLNCAANSRMRHSSMSRPPMSSDLSQTTLSLPRTNCTMDTEKRAWPIEQNATVIGLSGSKSFER
mmetsp:Transcript_62617/g.193911  ORF Transcript_62617/g.193911 Transcript_62617/m.193911 type:complete len:259 (-) Transcript_62617:617-1393(-)